LEHQRPPGYAPRHVSAISRNRCILASLSPLRRAGSRQLCDRIVWGFPRDGDRTSPFGNSRNQEGHGQKDRVKARELLVSLGPSDRFAVVLLDHDLLPRSPEEMTPSYLKAAADKISDAQAAVIIAILAASAQRGSNNRAQPNRPGITYPEPSLSACNMLTTGSWLSGMWGNPLCD
jgi:hypothetical protein